MFTALVSRGLWCPPTVEVVAPGIVDCMHTVVSTPIPTASLASTAGISDSEPETGCATAELTSASGGSDLGSS